MLCIGTKEGIINVRTSARRGEDDRWRKKDIGEKMAVPWEPIPGQGMRAIKSKAHIAGVASCEDIPEPQIRQAVPRRMRLDTWDLEKYG